MPDFEKNVIINKSITRGIVNAIPSKSYLHRLLIASFLCFDSVTINNIILSDDIMATMLSLVCLGAHVDFLDNSIEMLGKRYIDLNENEIVLRCNNSASTLRFLVPIVIELYPDVEIKADCSNELMERGIDVYIDLFDKCTIVISKYEEEKIVRGHKLVSKGYKFKGKLDRDEYYIRGDKSSQYISGLIFASCLKKADTKIIIEGKIESKNYIDMTIDVLKRYGMDIEFIDNVITVKGGKEFYPHDEFCEGDYSNASFFHALNYLDKNNKVEVVGLNKDSLQGDKVYQKYFDMLYCDSPCIDVSNCIDLAPILFALAAHLNGAHFINTKRLASKESDRAHAMEEELKKFGCNIKVYDNEVVINKSKLHTPDCLLDGHKDHRIIMSLAILCTYYGGAISNFTYVSKSYPNFFDDLKQLGVSLEFVKDIM